MDDWEKFDETSLHEKEDFYSHLNVEDITDADYAHAKRVCKDFEIKNLVEYHHLYIQSDTLLLADVFEDYRNMCFKRFERDPATFLSAPGLTFIDMNTDHSNKTKNDFEKYFFMLMNNAVFRKTMENVRKHRDIKFVTTKRRRNYLVSEPNYHTTKFFTKNLLAIEMKKQKYL